MKHRKRNCNADGSRDGPPWKEWTAIASFLTAVATLLGVLLHLVT